MLEYCKVCGEINSRDYNKIDCFCAKKEIMVKTIGERFINLDLMKISPTIYQKKILEILQNSPEQSYYFYGETGIGKTYLMNSVFVYLLKKYNTKVFRYFTFDTLHDFLKRAAMSDDYMQFFYKGMYGLERAKFIFIDDLNQITFTPTVIEYLKAFIDYIYRQNKHLFITNKSAPGSFGIVIGDNAYARRIEDICKIIYFKK